MRPEPIGWKPAVVKRRLRQLEKRIEALCLDLEVVENRLPVPSAEELHRFECGAAFTPESVLFGVVHRSRSSLLKTLVLISDMVSIPPDELRRWGLSTAERAVVLEEIRAAHAKSRRKRKLPAGRSGGPEVPDEKR